MGPVSCLLLGIVDNSLLPNSFQGDANPQGFNGLNSSLGEKLDNLTERVKRVEDVTRQGQNQRRAPGTQKAA
jgi:hypothetical protein